MDHAVAHANLTYKDAVANQKLRDLAEKMIEADHALLLHDISDKMETLIKSPLYDCLKLMPKPAVHHAHLTACGSPDLLLSLTYKNCVYYSQKNNDFHVSALGCDKEGYIKVNTLRQYWKDSQ